MFLNQHIGIRIIKQVFNIVSERVVSVSCSDTVTLQAFLFIGITPITEEVPVQWEQLSGFPVNWLTPINTTQVTFEQPTIRNDKIFRIHVYKNTINHVYRDVLVTAIPTDIVVSNQYSNKVGTTILDLLGGFSISDITPYYDSSSELQPYMFFINNTYVDVPSSYKTTFSVYKTTYGALEKIQDIEVYGPPPLVIPVYGIDTGKSYFVRRTSNNGYLDSAIKSHYTNNSADLLQPRVDVVVPTDSISNMMFDSAVQLSVVGIFSPSILPIPLSDTLSSPQYTPNILSGITFVLNASLLIPDIPADIIVSSQYQHNVSANITFVSSTSGTSLG